MDNEKAEANGGSSQDPPKFTPRRRKRKDASPRPIVLAIRGRPEWREWVDRLAAADRTSLNELVDRSLARYAREIGFREAPPER
jgi:hypothetical protein